MAFARPPIVAIVPDGNRRWARLKGVTLEESYMRALDAIRGSLEYLFWSIGSPFVYLYSSSLENCIYRRGPDARALERVASRAGIPAFRQIEREGVNVYFYGCLEAAPFPLREYAESRVLEAPPKPPAAIVLTCYSLLAETRRRRLLGLNPQAPLVDLLYRSGGEKRLSGFPPTLVSYAELFFDDEYWPAAGVRGVARAVKWYLERERRFGR